MATPLPAAIRSDHAQHARDRTRVVETLATRPIRWRLILSAWLLLAMVLAQTVGFVHGTAHVHEHRAGHPTADGIAAESAETVAAALEQLFDGHDDAAQCRLYDQVSRGDCAPTADMARPALVPVVAVTASAAIPWVCGDCLPARARGPPLAG